MREGEGRYHQLFNELNDAALVAEVETGVIIEANREAEVLLGRRLDEIVGMHHLELHPPDKTEEYRAMFAVHIAQKLTHFCQRLAGGVKWVLLL